MQVVYFGRDLHTRSLGYLGSYCVEPDGRWIAREEIDAALDRGELVAIRPASAKEMRRAEQAAVLVDIMGQLRDTIGNILDHKEPEEVNQVLSDLSAAITSVNSLPTNALFDNQ